jgi:hypothetical protein
MRQSNLKHLVGSLDEDETRDLMLRATRACENYCRRRLVPFVGLVETHLAEGVDSTALAIASGFGDIAGLASAGYARAINGGGQVRKIWVDQRPGLYQEMWAYSDVGVSVASSAGGVQAVTAAGLLGGTSIAADTGELWFRSSVPVGARVTVTYSGGYMTIPQDLVQACRYMAAADVVDEDDFPGAGPSMNSHADDTAGRSDSGYLARAQRLLQPYCA